MKPQSCGHQGYQLQLWVEDTLNSDDKDFAKVAFQALQRSSEANYKTGVTKAVHFTRSHTGLRMVNSFEIESLPRNP